MTDFPDLKLKALVSFPAAVFGGTGIAVRKVNGQFYFDIDYADFAPPVTGLPDPDHQNALIWNSVTGVYSLTPVVVFGGAGGIPDGPADGKVYGRLNAAWADISGNTAPLMNGAAAAGVSLLHSRQDHIHPIDTSRAPLVSPNFSGDPQAPTPPPGDNDQSIATTAFVISTVAGSGGPSGGIPEAPADGTTYGRRNLLWEALPAASGTNPVMDGVAAPGVAVTYSRGDHVHPSDTSRAPLASPTFTGDPKAPNPPIADCDTSIATTAFINQNQLIANGVDLNTITAPGTYATANVAGNPNEPTGAGQWYLHVWGYSNDANHIVQLAVSLLNDASIYTRVKRAGAWQAWQAWANVAASVASFNARTGAVIAVGGDYAGVPTSYNKQQSYTIGTLADGANINWNVLNDQKAKVTLGGNRTMNAVSNAVEGATYFLWVIQDGTGSRTLAFTTSGAGSFDFGTFGAPTLTTTPNRADLLCFEALTIAGTLKLRYAGIKQGFS